MDYRGNITIELGKRGGKPIIRRLRITISGSRVRPWTLTSTERFSDDGVVFR